MDQVQSKDSGPGSSLLASQFRPSPAHPGTPLPTCLCVECCVSHIFSDYDGSN